LIAFIGLLTATCACNSRPQHSDNRSEANRPLDRAGGPRSAYPTLQGLPDLASAPKCVSASELPAPPRKLIDRKPDLSNVHDVQTHGGVLIFDVTIGPAGNVAGVRLMKNVDTACPWPTIAERWRSAISGWRYEPQTLNNTPVAVCATVTVTIDVR
jgi:hypothetical protein